MIVVTAGTGEYRDIITEQRRRCARWGYEHRVYDLGGLGFGEPFQVRAGDLKPTIGGDTLPPATFKADLVGMAMREAKENEIVCWLDGDCLPLTEFEPHMPRESVGVTLRPKPEIGGSKNPALDYLNSGVVWIRINFEGREFLRDWLVASKEMRTDQGALNQCIGLRMDSTPEAAAVWEAAMNTSVPLRTGGNALILDCSQWNSWHLPPKPDTRILHFKRGIRSAASNYL